MKKNDFKEFWHSLSPEEKSKLADTAKTSTAYLSQIANGHRNAGWKTIQSLAAANAAISIEMFRQQAS